MLMKYSYGQQLENDNKKNIAIDIYILLNY